MPPALWQVSPRQKADCAQQRDRDRAAVVQDGVLPQAVHSDRQSLGRAHHPDEVVQAGLRRGWLYPPGTEAETIRPLEEREGRAALVR